MKKITFAVSVLTLCSLMLTACGGAAAPADQTANSAPVAAPAGGAVGQNGQGGPGGGGPGGFVNINRKRAPELPADNPIVSGPIVSHSSTSLMVRVGFGRRGQGGPGQAQGTPPVGPTATLAPPVAVEIDASTKIYSDTTQFDPAATQNGQEIQQTVALVDSLDALNIPADSANTEGANGNSGFGNNRGTVQVWGDTSTGKLVATVIVYSVARGRPPGQGQQATPTP